MGNQMSRRNLLKKAAVAAGGVTTASVAFEARAAAETGQQKKVYGPPPKEGTVPLFSSAVSYGNLLFLAGVGAHDGGTIQEQTKQVLDQLEKTLISAGSSMEKVLKVNVYLGDIKDWAAMNTVYAGRWGSAPPVRTTVAPGGIPGNSLIEIDLIAYI